MKQTLFHTLATVPLVSAIENDLCFCVTLYNGSLNQLHSPRPSNTILTQDPLASQHESAVCVLSWQTPPKLR